MYGYDIFHEDLMKTLIDAVRRGVNSHAYIFEGDFDLNIAEAAKLFAAALACVNSEVAPCGSCSSCTTAMADANSNIVFVNPDKGRKTIGIKNIRELEKDMIITPFASKRKVYVFPDASAVTREAQNALLKTLEEPPEYVAFIMVTENSENLLQTIRSRAVIVNFPPVSESMVRKYISENYPEATDRLDFLAKYCDGVPKRADKIIADEEFEPLRKSALEKLPLLLSGRVADTFSLQDFVGKNNDKFMQLTEFWMSFLRDVLLLGTNVDSGIINADKTDGLRSLCALYEPQKIVSMIDALATAQKMTARYIKPKAIVYWLTL